MGKNNYTVYKLTNKINGKLYIGITSRDVYKRWNNGHGYKGQVVGDAINKYGWDNFEKVILYKGISQKEAFKIEQDLIKKYKTQIKKHGYNRSAGGESGSYKSYNAQHKRMVKTYQYDLDGNFLKEYCSIEEAKRQLDVKGGNISSCCNGYRKVAHGYRWFHEFKGKKIEELESKEDRIKKSRIKEIYQYSLSGEFIKKFKSITEAENVLKNSGIKRCVSKKTYMSAGFMWFDEYKGKKINPYKGRAIPIIQENLKDNTFTTYITIQEASKKLGISRYWIEKYINNKSIFNDTTLKYAI